MKKAICIISSVISTFSWAQTKESQVTEKLFDISIGYSWMQNSKAIKCEYSQDYSYTGSSGEVNAQYKDVLELKNKKNTMFYTSPNVTIAVILFKNLRLQLGTFRYYVGEFNTKTILYDQYNLEGSYPQFRYLYYYTSSSHFENNFYAMAGTIGLKYNFFNKTNFFSRVGADYVVQFYLKSELGYRETIRSTRYPFLNEDYENGYYKAPQTKMPKGYRINLDIGYRISRSLSVYVTPSYLYVKQPVNIDYVNREIGPSRISIMSKSLQRYSLGVNLAYAFNLKREKTTKTD